LVAYIEALLVQSPYGRPSDSCIAAIADAHFNQALASLNVLTDFDFTGKAYMERTAGEFFKAYGFVAREGEEDDEAAAAAAAEAAAAATAAEEEEEAAAATSTPRYSLD
jgi:hypothetical protein